MCCQVVVDWDRGLPAWQSVQGRSLQVLFRVPNRTWPGHAILIGGWFWEAHSVAVVVTYLRYNWGLSALTRYEQDLKRTFPVFFSTISSQENWTS